MEEIKAKRIVRRVIGKSLCGIADDPGMAQRVLRIAHEKEARKNAGTIGRGKLAIAALIFALVLATTAFALTRPAVLNLLTGNAPASAQLESTAQSVTGIGAADGIAVRITGVVFDGENLAFSYELENDRPDTPALVSAGPAINIDGRPFPLTSCTATSDAPQMVPSPRVDVLPVRRNPAVGGGAAYTSGLTGGKAACELTFTVYRPENKFAVLLDPDGMQARADSLTGDARAEAEDSLDTLRSFRNAVFTTEADLERRLDEGCTLIDGSGTLYDLPENSHLAETAQISVTFEFDASAAFACDFAGAGDRALDGAALHVERLRLSSLETYVDLRLIPPENTESAARSLAQRYGAYVLTDERGEPVVYSEMDYMADTAPHAVQIDGQWVCRYLARMPGLLRFPESVAFVAGGEELLRFDLTPGE